MKTIVINSDYIKLDQFLKFADIVSSGGESKVFIAEHDILVNGELESRRGRKLRHKDRVEVLGKTFQINKDGEKE